jgi:radical SAM superfamily enzyme
MADATAENGLIAPLWSARKQESMREIRNYFDKNNIMQGRLHASPPAASPTSPAQQAA